MHSHPRVPAKVTIPLRQRRINEAVQRQFQLSHADNVANRRNVPERGNVRLSKLAHEHHLRAVGSAHVVFNFNDEPGMPRLLPLTLNLQAAQRVSHRHIPLQEDPGVLHFRG